MFVENKKTRVPGKPRHFIDAYLDELEKVGFVFLFWELLIKYIVNYNIVVLFS